MSGSAAFVRKTIATIVLCLLCGLVGCESPAPQDNASPSEARPPALTSTPAERRPDVISEETVEALPATVSSESNIWSRLQQVDTHYFVLVRHALAPGTGDPANFQLGDCATQRNLSVEGRTQAKQIGDAFRERNIAVRQVLSSQWCRCLETAELMALGPVEPFPPLNSFFRDRNSGPTQTAQIREFILNQEEDPGVTVMVTHFVNISSLSGVNVSSGEMVVLHVNDQQELAVIGQINAL